MQHYSEKWRENIAVLLPNQKFYYVASFYTLPTIPGIFSPENIGVTDPNLFEGDMLLTPAQRFAAMSGRDVSKTGQGRASINANLWPGAVLPYELDPAIRKSHCINRYQLQVANTVANLPPPPPPPPPSPFPCLLQILINLVPRAFWREIIITIFIYSYSAISNELLNSVYKQ